MKTIAKFIGNVISALMTLLLLAMGAAFLAKMITGAGVAIVSGESMLPTLEHKELVLYTETDMQDIDYFDIILVKDEILDVTVVKRVVGKPGDDVAIIEGDLFINKQLVEEPYISDTSYIYKTESYRTKLGSDEYYLLGDNRDNSKDSRDSVKPVSWDDIIGKVNRKLIVLGDNDEN